MIKLMIKLVYPFRPRDNNIILKKRIVNLIEYAYIHTPIRQFEIDFILDWKNNINKYIKD
jgi:hypothetical protein